MTKISLAAHSLPVGAEVDRYTRLLVGVESEVEPLRRVIVHRPGPELRRVTPENRSEMLFDEVVWPERAAEEHDALVDALRGAGAEVLYLERLLSETLADPRARWEALNETCREVPSPLLRGQLEGWLAYVSETELAQRLIHGIAFSELPFSSGSLMQRLSDPDDFVLAPLPNQMFARDPSAWVGRTVSIHQMAHPSRRREALHFDLIYRYHTLFADRGKRLPSHELEAPLEGGDVLVLGRHAVLIGLGARTSPGAAEAYAHWLFRSTAVEQVIAIPLPSTRATMHLDTVLTLVDRDAAIVFSPLRDELRALILTPQGSGIAVTETRDPFGAIADALGIRQLRLITADGDGCSLAREQWDDGNNVLAVSPGVVLTYERNTRSNESLRAAGVEVIPLPCSELSRARGGPRCLTCPVERSAY